MNYEIEFEFPKNVITRVRNLKPTIIVSIFN
jgi:hypothetical protein